MSDDVRALLAGHRFLAGLGETQLDELASCARLEDWPAGTTLFEEGADADRSLLVLDGRVSLRIHDPGLGPAQVQTVGAGGVVGWSWLLDPHRWHFDAIATQATRAVVLDGSALRPLLTADPLLGYELSRRFLGVVTQRLEQLRMQLIDVYHRKPTLPATEGA